MILVSKPLDEIMGQYEAECIRYAFICSVSQVQRKLAQRLGVSCTAIASQLKQYGISK